MVDATLTVDEVPEGTSVTECDLIGEVINDERASIQIPTPGHAVTLTEYTEELTIPTNLTVAVDLAGEISYDMTEDSAVPTPGEPDPRPACLNDNFSLLGKKWGATARWSINRASIPQNNVLPDNAVQAIRDAMQNITGSRNNCGMSDLVSASAGYQGDTNLGTQIGSPGQADCPTEGNGNSTVAFGPRPPYVLATTCAFATVTRPDEPGIINEGDIRIDDDHNWTTYGGLPDCSSADSGRTWDVENVMTHEFGHFFGLAHANGDVLTMYQGGHPCDISDRSLAKGDVLGLRSYY